MSNHYLDQLNEAQKAAVTATEGPVMVIAGPGSGKTRVLTYRIAYLIEQGIPPWQILALTFTNKAAREMKDRIEGIIGHTAQKVWAGTFHSIFARILRVEARLLGYPPTFTIYDTDDSRSVIKDIVKEMGLDKNAYNVNALRNRISSAKSNLITWKAYADDPDLMEMDRMNRRPMTYKIYEKYAKRLERAGAMDFDDLLLLMFKLLYENKENVRGKYQRQFRYVLVDEFQDTNYLQYAIVKMLVDYPGSHQNLCIVGDDAQSIYAFRGATIDNIFDFQRDFEDVQIFKLEQNYRSTHHIVQAANQVITNNKKQIEKKIWTDRTDGFKIKIIRALSDTEEGRMITGRIIELKSRHHYSNSEFAILYRTNAQSRIFEEHLRRQNLPYKIFGGLSFYQRKEVKDLLAYLRITVNPTDNEAFKRIVNFPKRGIGSSTIDKVLTYANSEAISAWEAIDNVPLSSRASNLLRNFKQMIISFRKKSEKVNAYDTVLHIYKQSGLYDLLKNDTSLEGINRIENVNALLDGVKQFTDNDEVLEGDPLQTDKSLSAYLQNIALLTDFDQEEDPNKDYISLMSAHAAKGLEFKSVFVVGLEENLFPSYMSMDSPESLDEERRLFYVAITRAEEQLTLSYANSRYQYGNMRFNDMSRFLEEIDEEHLEDTAHIQGFREPSRPQALVGGYFKKHKSDSAVMQMDPADFKPSPPSQILPGKSVLHLKFGRGEVVDVDGNNDTKVATIMFEELENPKRRIMLKFAKLQVVD
jgi:DNA helicase-2/ATP-dependent DNA helicase PcrA